MGTRRPVRQDHFAQIPRANIPRSKFNRSHTHKTTFNSGMLVPFFIDEVLPGDTFSARATIFARLATPIAPIMDNMYLETHYFFVPNRLLWDNWQKMNGEQDNPGDSTDFLVPIVRAPAGGFSSGSLEDYFGIPVGVPNLEVNALWHRAYNLIYNEWYRDQNLQSSVPINRGDGPDNPADYTLLRRGKRHDYFTSCLPWPQKGPGVELPLGEGGLMGTAPVTLVGNGSSAMWRIDNTNNNAIQASGTDLFIARAGATTANIFFNTGTGANVGLTGTVSDWSNVNFGISAVTINSLRQAFQMQKLFERDARGGTRYTEIVRSHFGVISPDARLQRPEYLGGGHQRVIVNPVPQTSASVSNSPQGNLAAFGIVSDSTGGFTKSFTEHGVIIGLLSVRADLTYQQGLNRMFSRRDRYDYYWPVFATLGEQAVLSKEIYAAGNDDDENVFGYQERYAEYRYFPSKITGLFRSQSRDSAGNSNTLHWWHLSQQFGTRPTLGSDFIVENPPMARVKAVTSEPDFIADMHISLTCARPMPVYSVPGLIDHF